VDYDYTDIAAIADSVDEILARHGLFYRWKPTNDFASGMVTQTCIVSHKLGYSEETTLTAKVSSDGRMNHIQAIAAAATFLGRYTLQNALGLASKHDDDGRAAGPIIDAKAEPSAPTGPVITAEQVNELDTFIKDKKVPLAQFLGWCGIDKLENMAAADFAKRKHALLVRYSPDEIKPEPAAAQGAAPEKAAPKKAATKPATAKE
jgi:hypothetical protein